EKRSGARMAVGGHAFEDLVAVVERGRHQIGRLVAGEAEHDTLVARAFVLVAAGVGTLCELRGRAVEVVFARQQLPGTAVLFVTDSTDRVAHRPLDLVESPGRPLTVLVDALAANFAGQNDELRGGQSLAGDASLRVLRQ